MAGEEDAEQGLFFFQPFGIRRSWAPIEAGERPGKILCCLRCFRLAVKQAALANVSGLVMGFAEFDDFGDQRAQLRSGDTESVHRASLGQ